MPFQQPAPITVRQTHFRGKTYTFLVESVLAPHSKTGELLIDASGGYLLTTSINKTPPTKKTFPYVKQPDDSWLASGTVNLIANVSALVSGSVTLQDSLGEMLILPISIDPALFVDSSEISFDETKLGDTTATILNVRQRGALTPINLKVEPQQHFSIADAKMAMVSVSNLTITPAFDGSNIIVIYKPNRAGRNTAQLIVTAPYETKTVKLIGQPGGLLSRFRFPGIPRLQLPEVPRLQLPELPRFHLPEISRPHLLEIPRLKWPVFTNRRPLIGGVIAIVFGGVLWVSYTMLAKSENRIDLTVLSKPAAEAHAKVVPPTRRLKKPVEKPVEPLPQIASVEPVVKDTTATDPVAETPIPKPVLQPKEKIFTKKIAARVKLVKLSQPKVATVASKAPVTAKVSVPVKSPASGFSVNQVSELEKELNGPISLKKP